mmetsp:Transcript_18184/g.48000  ORF Transcript_18184/g.48000 Transcript_18184/m.48000 type:complete len:207 (-) Transcript_18184:113-733(-)
MLRTLVALVALIATVATAEDVDGKKLFASGRKKAEGLSKKLARRGLSLEQGDEIPENFQKDIDAIVELFTRSADAGYVEAQHALGGFYNVGYMVPEKDDVAAAEYFRLAAEQGKAESMSNLATMYKDGVGVEQNFEKALELYNQAYDAGNDMSGFNLAAMHANGIGTEKDLYKARELLEGILGFQGAPEALAQVESMIATEEKREL